MSEACCHCLGFHGYKEIFRNMLTQPLQLFTPTIRIQRQLKRAVADAWVWTKKKGMFIFRQESYVTFSESVETAFTTSEFFSR